MLKEIRKKEFANGAVYALETEDGYPIEVTDTFLPFYTKNAIGRKQNLLQSNDLGSRAERWMIGVSTMSGCPVHCKFCATGQLKKWRKLTDREIAEQVFFVIMKHETDPKKSKEFKINYTRMGEPFLNIDAVKQAIDTISSLYPNAHHYISTIGIKNSDFSWIKDNITLQFSIHALNDKKRDWLIPYSKKMTLEEIGKVRTESALKTTLNMTLVDEDDFNINTLRRYFDNGRFFVKLSPINKNTISDSNSLGSGVIVGKNLK